MGHEGAVDTHDGRSRSREDLLSYSVVKELEPERLLLCGLR